MKPAPMEGGHTARGRRKSLTGAVAATVLLMAGLLGSGTQFLSPVKVAYTPTATMLSVNPFLVQAFPLKVYYPTVSAILTTSTGTPLAGETVAFTVNGMPICSATTDDDGLATCDGSGQTVAILVNRGYTATYAGSANYLPSSGHGDLLRIGTPPVPQPTSASRVA